MNLRQWSLRGLLAVCLFAVVLVPGVFLAADFVSKWYSEGHQPFMIKVVDSKTGRGIPLVELQTTNKISYYTDSAGIVAFNEPGLMNQSVFFHLKSDGYEYPKDGYGNRGKDVEVTPGGSVTLKMDRTQIAERMYRVTGQGIYRDSVLLGLNPPIQKPLLNGKVMGSDSVQTIKYKDRLYWFWGDTDKPSYPLGNFRVTGATSRLPQDGGLKPDVGVDLNYFTQEDGFAKSLVPPLPDGAGIAWVFGLMTAKDSQGEEQLLAGYSTHDPDLASFGILKWNDEKKEFEQAVQFPSKDDWRHPGGQAAYYEEKDKGYWVFSEHHFPNLRVASDYNAIIDYKQYESFTCLEPGTTYKEADTKLERDQKGELVWDWKKNTPPLTQKQEKELIKLGLIQSGDPRYFQLKDADTGDSVEIASSAIQWNDYRKKYVMIGQQLKGKNSDLGEIWYAEASSPQGPWNGAKKIVTHDNYTFYNVALHPYFAQDGGRVIYFEGTYTATFTDHVPTPYYNYNQMMYKLDLEHPQLNLPLHAPKKETKGR